MIPVPVRSMAPVLLVTCLLSVPLALPLAVWWADPAAATAGAAERDPLERPATMVRHPERVALLGIASAGARLVAVGERGVVVLSDDGGATWRQARVPVSVTLTAVAFPSPSVGWAVGHAGVVLRSANGGESWQAVLDGRRAAALALDAARAAGVPDGVRRAERLVADGPDKPFLGLWFPEDKRGLVVGAYGLLFSTEDGGASWQAGLDRLDNPDERHLNAIAASGPASGAVSGATVYLAGEQGLLARSDDGGKTFQRLTGPYEGSLFAVAVAGDGSVLAGGLRGNLFRSEDRGERWRRVEGLPPVSVNALLGLADGALLSIGQAGDLGLIDPGGGATVLPVELPAAPSDLARGADGGVVVVGLRGATPLPKSLLKGVRP